MYYFVSVKRDALLLYYSQLYVGKCSESTNLLQTLLEQILYPHAKNMIVWIHRFCLRKFTKCTKPLECWPCVCVCVWPLKYTQLQPMTFLSVAPSLCLSLKHTYYFSGLWVTAALFQFSVHFLLWRTPAVRFIKTDDQHTSVPPVHFLFLFTLTTRWSFANYEHNHQINHPQCLFLVKGLC